MSVAVRTEFSADSLAGPVQYVPGVGPRLAARLANLGIETVHDLLMHLPARYVDCRIVDATGRVAVGPHRTVVGVVRASGSAWMGRSRRKIFEALIDDGSGVVSAKWFHFRESYLAAQLPIGARVRLTGDVTAFGNTAQFIHPDVEAIDADDTATHAARILPIYPATEGVTQRMFGKIIAAAWEKYGARLQSCLPSALASAHGLWPLADAVHAVHCPELTANVAALNARDTPAHRTLIFDEIFLLEVGLALRRAATQQERGAAVCWDAQAARDFAHALPFTLTAAQERVLHEIAIDVQRGVPMRRLVQGDVGSGKTAVAAATAVQLIRAGYQVAIMAPTEILALQHFRTMLPWLSALNISHELLTGTTRASARREILAALQDHRVHCAIGTHALLEGDVQFAKLGLVIIDEQHRFGVAQRLQLQTKATLAPHLLVLTATPIPRTLAMTAYGDLDISCIDELPAGRLPVLTKWYTDAMREKLLVGMRRELERGRQVYVVYPLVEESEKVDLKNATAMAQELAVQFEPNFRVAVLHGRMKGDEKEATMQAFKRGEIHILATTSVVEVGVDVQNATVMVIEHADRFGLSQLHQLRGRVGRGAHQSYCILVAARHVSDDARQRLSIMVETTDGFRIAEEDLKIRGPGEILGTRQSGLPELRIARLVEDSAMIAQARQAAFALIEGDPQLASHPTVYTAVRARWGATLQLGD